jgi:L1 cell adhesion molecule like protein
MEHGTIYQIRNLIGRSNVVTQPKNDMNACEDFLKIVLYSYITVAAMEILEIDEVDEIPSSFDDDIWLQSEDERKRKMEEILIKIVHKFIDIKYNAPCSTTKDDRILQYSKQLLSIGCVFLEIVDAVKQGDGVRMLHCWKYLMIIYHNSN